MSETKRIYQLGFDDGKRAVLSSPGWVHPVRCRDCEHYIASPGVCVHPCSYGLGVLYVAPDAYCSYGQLRDA